MPNTRRQRLSPQRAFTLVEILIVVMILSIMAMIVMPRYSLASDEARHTALKDQLRVVREQLVVFSAQHGGRWPGLTASGAVGAGDLFLRHLTQYSDGAGDTATRKDATHVFGPYLRMTPENPISQMTTVKIDATIGTPAADDSTGWIYQPRTGRLFVNSTRQDPNGKDYIAY